MYKVFQSGEYIWCEKDLLGKGDFGTVYKGKKGGLREIAIKVQDIFELEKEGVVELLMSEIRIQRSLKCPQIVELVDAFRDQQYLYIVLELCTKGDLRKLLTGQPNFRLPEMKAISLLEQIKAGFEKIIEANLIHRDMKPENVLIGDDGICKIGDFGFAARCDSQVKQLRDCCGTPLYMSPQVMNGENYSSKADIWSLGMMFYEMIFGKGPWPFYDPKNFLRGLQKNSNVTYPYQIKISEVTKQFINRCLAYEEEKRMDWKEFFSHPIYQLSKNPVQASLKQIIFGTKELETLNKLKKELMSKVTNLPAFLASYQSTDLNLQSFLSLISNWSNQLNSFDAHLLFKALDFQNKNLVPYQVLSELLLNYSFEPNSKSLHILDELQNIIVCNSINVNDIFNSFDQDRSGQLNKVEFACLIKRIAPQIADYDIKELFKLTDANKDDDIQLSELRQVLVDINMRNFMEQRGEFVKSIINSLQEYIKMNNIDISQLFSRFDSNKSDQLSVEETGNFLRSIYNNLTQKEIQAVFLSLDKNHDGSINFQEFRQVLSAGVSALSGSYHSQVQAILMKLKSVISNNQLNISQIFTNFDQDKNGILDYNEFSKLVKCIDATVNVENIRSLFGFFDLNKDGKILFDEFQRALR